MVRPAVGWIHQMYDTLPSMAQQALAHVASTCMLTYLVCQAFYAKLQIFARSQDLAPGPFTSLRSWLDKRALAGEEACDSTAACLKQPNMCLFDYVTAHGYGCEDELVTTEDGYRLLLHHVFALSADGHTRKQPRRDVPVLLMHGLLQSAGVFVTSGPNSFAFWLVDQGYDVWLGNNRAVPCDRHTSPLGRQSPLGYIPSHVHWEPTSTEFWDWSVDELGHYDFPALLRHVLQKTGKPQLHYIGHSQGTAQAFIGLSRTYDEDSLHTKLKSFTALAPAVSIGPLISYVHAAICCPQTSAIYYSYYYSTWPLSRIIHLSTPADRISYVAIFGRKQFIPLMTFVHRLFPARLFRWIAYEMFAFLFNWVDLNWDQRYKDHYFQFTPRPTSCKSILHWTDIAKLGWLAPFRGCDLVPGASNPPRDMKVENITLLGFHEGSVSSAPVGGENGSLETAFLITADGTGMASPVQKYHGEEWIDHGYDLSPMHRIPLLLVWGSKDYLIQPDRMLTMFDAYAARGKPMNIVMKECIDNYEHLDFLWSVDAAEKVWQKVHSELMRLDSN